jgi:hypothetical protein
MATEKSEAPNWTDVSAVLLTFQRKSLLGLLADLYAASEANQAFLHARFGLGQDQLASYKASISRWIGPDLSKDQPVSIAKAMKAIAAYKKAVGRPEGLAELSLFYCEEALRFFENGRLKDDGYFAAFLRMYDRCLSLASILPRNERDTYLLRLARLETRGRRLGRDVQDEVETLWQSTDRGEPTFGQAT